jgi:Immunity protein 27
LLGSLVLIGSADGGWTRIYRDPNGGLFWELTYPHSEMHGGGPPRLESYSLDELRLKYPDLNVDLH